MITKSWMEQLNDISFLYLETRCLDITRFNMMNEYQTLGDVYTIEFSIIVSQMPAEARSVFYFTETDSDRIPAVFVNKKICIINTNLKTFCFTFEQGKMYQMTIRHFIECEKYWYEILVDGNSMFKMESTAPKSSSNVNFYASDPWHEPFSSDVGSICNVKICK